MAERNWRRGRWWWTGEMLQLCKDRRSIDVLFNNDDLALMQSLVNAGCDGRWAHTFPADIR
jgi:hypothetical protein